MTMVLGAALLVVRIVLAIVFVVAAVAKLRDIPGTAQMLRDFGVPRGPQVALAWLLPVIELFVAIALIPTATASAGGLAAVCVLGVFTAAIAVNLSLGRKPACRCFGQVASAPIGPGMLARNAALLLAGAFAWLGPAGASDPAVFAWLNERLGWSIAAAVVFGFLTVQTFLMVQILRQQGRMLLRLDAIDVPGFAPEFDGHTHGEAEHVGLPIGTAAPSFDLPALAGPQRALGDFVGLGKRTLLLFAHPACGPCEALLPDVARWQGEYAERLTLVVVSSGNLKENHAVFDRHEMANVMLQSETTVSDAYSAYGTPAAVLIEADGSIGSGVAAGADAIRELVERAVTPEPEPMPVLARGDAAPVFAGRTLTGETIGSERYRGERVALLFWSPDCGYCRSMADDLARWDAEHDGLLVVSGRPDEELVALGLRAPQLIDESAAIGRAFGAGGTPMAILIEPDGTLGSELAPGRDAVLRLFAELPAREQVATHN